MSSLRLAALAALSLVVGCISAPDLSGAVATLSFEGQWGKPGRALSTPTHTFYYFDDPECLRGKALVINAFTEKAQTTAVPAGVSR